MHIGKPKLNKSKFIKYKAATLFAFLMMSVLDVSLAIAAKSNPCIKPNRTYEDTAACYLFRVNNKQKKNVESVQKFEHMHFIASAWIPIFGPYMNQLIHEEITENAAKTYEKLVGRSLDHYLDSLRIKSDTHEGGKTFIESHTFFEGLRKHGKSTIASSDLPPVFGDIVALSMIDLLEKRVTLNENFLIELNAKSSKKSLLGIENSADANLEITKILKTLDGKFKILLEQSGKINSDFDEFTERQFEYFSKLNSSYLEKLDSEISKIQKEISGELIEEKLDKNKFLKNKNKLDKLSKEREKLLQNKVESVETGGALLSNLLSLHNKEQGRNMQEMVEIFSNFNKAAYNNVRGDNLAASQNFALAITSTVQFLENLKNKNQQSKIYKALFIAIESVIARIDDLEININRQFYFLGKDIAQSNAYVVHQLHKIFSEVIFTQEMVVELNSLLRRIRADQNHLDKKMHDYFKATFNQQYEVVKSACQLYKKLFGEELPKDNFRECVLTYTGWIVTHSRNEEISGTGNSTLASIGKNFDMSNPSYYINDIVGYAEQTGMIESYPNLPNTKIWIDGVEALAELISNDIGKNNYNKDETLSEVEKSIADFERFRLTLVANDQIFETLFEKYIGDTKLVYGALEEAVDKYLTEQFIDKINIRMSNDVDHFRSLSKFVISKEAMAPWLFKMPKPNYHDYYATFQRRPKDFVSYRAQRYNNRIAGFFEKSKNGYDLSVDKLKKYISGKLNLVDMMPDVISLNHCSYEKEEANSYSGMPTLYAEKKDFKNLLLSENKPLVSLDYANLLFCYKTIHEEPEVWGKTNREMVHAAYNGLVERSRDACYSKLFFGLEIIAYIADKDILTKAKYAEENEIAKIVSITDKTTLTSEDKVSVHTPFGTRFFQWRDPKDKNICYVQNQDIYGLIRNWNYPEKWFLELYYNPADEVYANHTKLLEKNPAIPLKSHLFRPEKHKELFQTKLKTHQSIFHEKIKFGLKNAISKVIQKHKISNVLQEMNGIKKLLFAYIELVDRQDLTSSPYLRYLFSEIGLPNEQTINQILRFSPERLLYLDKRREKSVGLINSLSVLTLDKINKLKLINSKYELTNDALSTLKEAIRPTN